MIHLLLSVLGLFLAQAAPSSPTPGWELVQSLGHGPIDVAASPDGEVWVVVDPSALAVRDARTLELQRYLLPLVDGWWSAAFSPDGGSLVAKTVDGRQFRFHLPDYRVELLPVEGASEVVDRELTWLDLGAEVRGRNPWGRSAVWWGPEVDRPDVVERAEGMGIDREHPPWRAQAVDPRLRRGATLQEGELRVVGDEGLVRRRSAGDIPGEVTAVAPGDDVDFVATADGGLWRVDAEGVERVARLPDMAEVLRAMPGGRLAWIGRAGTLGSFDVEARRSVELPAGGVDVTAADLVDDRHLALVSAHRVVVYRLGSDRPEWITGGGYHGLAALGGGRWAASRDDGRIEVFDLRGRRTEVICGWTAGCAGERSWATDLQLSADGSLLVAVGHRGVSLPRVAWFTPELRPVGELERVNGAEPFRFDGDVLRDARGRALGRPRADGTFEELDGDELAPLPSGPVQVQVRPTDRGGFDGIEVRGPSGSTVFAPADQGFVWGLHRRGTVARVSADGERVVWFSPPAAGVMRGPHGAVQVWRASPHGASPAWPPPRVPDDRVHRVPEVERLAFATVAPDGVAWVLGKPDVLWRLERPGDALVAQPLPPVEASWWWMRAGADGALWLVGQDHLARRDISGAWTLHALPPAGPNPRVYALEVLRDGRVALERAGTVILADREGIRATHALPDGSSRVNQLVVLPDGLLHLQGSRLRGDAWTDHDPTVSELVARGARVAYGFDDRVVSITWSARVDHFFDGREARITRVPAGVPARLQDPGPVPPDPVGDLPVDRTGTVVSTAGGVWQVDRAHLVWWDGEQGAVYLFGEAERDRQAAKVAALFPYVFRGR